MNAFGLLKQLLENLRPMDFRPARPHIADELRPDTARQVAGLVVRRNKKGKREALLITSRDTGRWIAPKGWIEDDEDGAHAAAREVWEEAGVIARANGSAIGSYEYLKARTNQADIVCTVDIYMLDFKTEKNRWPEMHERKRKWVRLSDVLTTLEEPGLADALKATPLFRSAA